MRKERIFWGSFFILGGLALVLDKLGLVGDLNIINMVIAIFLLGIAIKSLVKLNFAGVLFPLAFIGILFDEQLGITVITPWTILITAGFLSIGLSLIFNKSHKFGGKSMKWDSKEYETIDTEGTVRIQSSFSGSVKYVNTEVFENAYIKSRFGGVDVYFDNAKMKDEKAIVKIDAQFSGVKLYIPRTWRVENNANVSFGALEENGRGGEVITNTLVIVGEIHFGGVEIEYI